MKRIAFLHFYINTMLLSDRHPAILTNTALAFRLPSCSPSRSSTLHYCSSSPSFCGKSPSKDIMEESLTHPAYVSLHVLKEHRRGTTHRSQRLSMIQMPKRPQSESIKRGRNRAGDSSIKSNSCRRCKYESKLKVKERDFESLSLKV